MEYKIEIFNDEMYSLNSTDNKNKYDCEIFDTKEKEHFYSSKCGIRILKNEELIKSVVFLGSGSTTRINQNSYVLNGQMLFVAVGSAVYCIQVPDLTMKWVVQGDDSCCFGIFRLIDNIVIHGELSVTCIDVRGNILWKYYGKDIFVASDDGINNFEVKENKISVKDWNNELYILNSDGKRIN